MEKPGGRIGLMNSLHSTAPENLGITVGILMLDPFNVCRTFT